MEDANDNPPTFDKYDPTQGVYIGYLAENMNVSASVLQIFVTDADPTPEFRNVSVYLDPSSLLFYLFPLLHNHSHPLSLKWMRAVMELL